MPARTALMSGRISEGGILKAHRGVGTSLAHRIATVRLALGVVERDDASLFVDEELRLTAGIRGW